MADIQYSTQEVSIINEGTGVRCEPDAAGQLPVLAGQTGTWTTGITGNVNTGWSTTPAIYNVTCTNANTEYSQALPAGCRRFFIQLRTVKDLKLSFTSGQSGTTYVTIPGGGQYSEDTLNLTSKTLYFQSTTAGVIAEIVAWV